MNIANAGDSFNIADRLAATAAAAPYQRAVVVPAGRDGSGRRVYGQRTFQQLDEESTEVARGLITQGIKPGDRIAFFVPPGLEMLSLVFGLFRSGATVILIDPGMGVDNLVGCLAETDPQGFVAVPRAQAARIKFRKRVPNAKTNICVGSSVVPLGMPYQRLLETGRKAHNKPPKTRADDLAAVIFTSGSTGPPKGVCYEHRMFDAQWQLIQQQYGIEPGEIDLPAFPLFGLFNVAMGVTTIVPEMDFTRPADVDASLIIEAIEDQGVTQAFGSPAFWRRIGRYATGQLEQRGTDALEQNRPLRTLKRALSAGAPVPVDVLEDMSRVMKHPESAFHTPYGATESLPACTMTGRDILEQTAAETRLGHGTCVGRPFDGIEVKVIRIPDRPVAQMVEVVEAETGEIGEIIVSGPSVTREYFERPIATEQSKIPDEAGRFWHRIGDVGYFDATGRLWFCGRKNHVVRTADGTLYPVQCEAIFNEHDAIERTALVGILGKNAKHQEPVLVVEPKHASWPKSTDAKRDFVASLSQIATENEKTASIKRFVFRRTLPVDTRHNVKINREQLGEWATTQPTYSSANESDALAAE